MCGCEVINYRLCGVGAGYGVMLCVCGYFALPGMCVFSLRKCFSVCSMWKVMNSDEGSDSDCITLSDSLFTLYSNCVFRADSLSFWDVSTCDSI